MTTTEKRSKRVATKISDALDALPMPLWGEAARADPEGSNALERLRDLLNEALSLARNSPTTRAVVDRHCGTDDLPPAEFPVRD